MNDAPPTRPWLLAAAGLLLTAAVSLTPLVLERPPLELVQPGSAALAWAGKMLVVLAMAAAIAVRTWADRRTERGAVAISLGMVAAAGLMTAFHWLRVDRVFLDWQQVLYLKILNHVCEPPHQYRSLPYGFVRSLEWLSGDWWFACVAYRWFFTWWFLWGAYRFARLFHGQPVALLTLAPLVALYPLSVWYYQGQLTDPLSHALFALALIYVVQDRPLLLAAALALGVLAKETAVIVVPAYLACYWRRPLLTLAKGTLLGLACTAAFLAVRLPLGWRPGNADMNGLDGLMIGANLGIGPRAATSWVPLVENYLHPLWFVGVFLPVVAWHWRRLDGRLRALIVTLVPLLLASNLCFGWMYESRNYLPLVPLLATAAACGLAVFAKPQAVPVP